MSSLLDEMVEAWRDVRAGVVEEVRNLPEKQLGFRPTAEARSVTELVQHIIESGGLMAGELSRPDGSFRRKSYAALLREHAPRVRAAGSRKRLVDALRRSQAEGERKLRRAGELHMLQLIVQFNGVPATRLSWMAHGIAHEEYHRGQLALYARLLGRVPALTKLIHGG